MSSNKSNIIELSALDTPEVILINNRPLTDEELTTIAAMNEKYAHIVTGAKHKIMTYKPCPIDGERGTYESIQDFYNYFEHKPLVAGVNQGKAWFKWSGKTFYSEGIGYYPNPSKAPSNLYNLFRGFGCLPITGNVSLILDHICAVLCGGDEIASKYFIQWLAHIVQQPDKKPSVAILMKSAEGTGKGTLFRLLAKMLGINAAQVNGHGQLTGRFNAVIAGKLLVCGDEVDLTSKAVFDKAKGIISEPTINLELKGIDAVPMPNYARFIFAGNHGQILRAGTRERRFLVIEPSSHKIEDKEYFNELNKLIDGNGASYFLEHLLNVDLSTFTPYSAPVTKGLIEEKLLSLNPVLSFFYEELTKDRPFNDMARIYATELVEKYNHWAERHSIQLTPASARSQTGQTMNKIGVQVQGRSGRANGKYYDLPSNEELRTLFAKHLGHKLQDIF